MLLQMAKLHSWNVCNTIPLYKMKWKSVSVVSDSLRPHGLYSPWNSLGQNPGVGSLSLLQGIFPTKGLNPGPLHCLEKEMATHPSILAWRIPWTEEPDELQSMGSQRVGHDWVASLPFTLLPNPILEGEWTHVYVWMSPFAVHLKPSQQR